MLKEELLAVTGRVDGLTDMSESVQSKHREEFLEIKEEIKVLRQELLAVPAKCEKMSTDKEEERPEPYVMLFGKESTECWSPSGTPPICSLAALPHGYGYWQAAAMENLFYLCEQDGRNCHVTAPGQKNWSWIPSLNVSER